MMRKSTFKRISAMILVLFMLISSVQWNILTDTVLGGEVNTVIYLKDNTQSKWLKNDNATFVLIDNTHNHAIYQMTKTEENLWSCEVPESAYNISFLRYNKEGNIKWNEWSAGGRDENNMYVACGAEYGHWENNAAFMEGQKLYLDLREFNNWEKSDALFYVNFSNYSKKDNNNNNVPISSDKVSPKKILPSYENHVYTYTVTKEDEGKTSLRFWRGNENTLWNDSIVFSYKDYLNGKNCVKAADWNNAGEITYYEENVDETLDTDGDGLYDYLEIYFNTDKLNPDTDGDGISDYIELIKISTNPLAVDSDNNSVSDGDEDADGDRLTNINEVASGTDLTSKDTDTDGITDGDEVYVTHTLPLVFDTDNDGVCDGRELELGTDPLVADSEFHVNLVSEDEDSVKASVDINLTGEQVDTLDVSKVDNEFLFPETMPGYIGGAYNFHVDGTFDSATLQFEFDEALLSNPDFDPVIYYFNEEEQQLEALDTTVTANTASATVNHFSNYILIDRKLYEASYRWEDEWKESEYSKVEIVFVIDDSGSMVSNDPANQRLTVTKNLIDNLPKDSKMGVVKFATNTSVLTSKLTTDKDEAKSFLTTADFVSYGNTYMYTAIRNGFNLYESAEPDVLKMMVVLSDGAAHDTSMHSSIVSQAVNKNVKIYTVGLGNQTSYFNNYLKPLATSTTGNFYLASNSDELNKIFDDINKKIELDLDTDNDGISDYYEEHMVMFNGENVPMDKNNPDSDGDGVSDGDEFEEFKIEYNADRTKIHVTGKFKSNPAAVDTDFDGINDDKDAKPIDNNFKGILKNKYGDDTVSSNVEYKMDYKWFFDNNTVYNKDLSVISSLYATDIYADSTLSVKDSGNNNIVGSVNIPDVMKAFGMENTKKVSLAGSYSDKHVSEVGLGYREVTYKDETKKIVSVVVRGTNGTIEEWSSNFDIGEDSTFGTSSDWKNKDNHKGFDVAANRIMRVVDQYLSENGLNASDCVFWITGHSRGAGIANIIGAEYEKNGRTSFTYTFASPNTTLVSNATSFNTIFNVVNTDDFVPYLPVTDWGYTRYGRTASVSIASNYEKQWEKLTSIGDYDPDTFGLDETIKAIGDIIPSGDARVEAYKYTCKCHGDNSSNNITIKNRGMSKNSREEAIAKIPDNALPYCKITRYDGRWFWGWDFEVCQTPQYFMQILAAKMGGKISNYRFVVELNIADRYENAKTQLIQSALGGLEHPHYPESYYVLAKNISSGRF